MLITYEDVKKNEKVNAYIKKADESLKAMGFTEHSFAHVTKVAENAGMILTKLGYSQREAEIARIAGYLHDIGNVVNRIDHAQSGALIAFRILENMGADAETVSTIVTAIGNHDESTAFPVNPVAAALIIADKTDVIYTRVRNREPSTFDIHDRVNYAVKKSDLEIDVEKCEIVAKLRIDITMCTVMDYFEIFLGRMVLCRKAADKLGMKFTLRINGQKLL
ncbi:MAG: HD domain-containing protein [Clostridia bacterium]|nr:HD domain-containing protein [Clostridia bacterium]